MSHTAFTCHALLQQLPVRIECMAVWQQVLLVGTHEGALLLYDVARRPDGGHDARVLDSHKTFGRRAITQLAVVARSNLVLSLSDGCVSVHDIGMQACEEEKLSRFVAHASLQNQAPVLTLRTQLKPRQAHLFAMDVSTPEGRLCVAAKKKLYFYRLAAGGKERKFEEVCERQGPDAAKALAWAGARVCVGYRKEYALLDVATGQVQELFETGKLGAPIATVMPGAQLLLNKDNISIFLGFDGKPTRKCGIAWPEAPLDFGYAFPYVIGLLPSGLELRTLTSPNTVQTLRACKGARVLVCGDEQLYCASASMVWRLDPLPIPDQVAQLVAENEFSEALNLLDCLPDSNEKAQSKRSINVQFGFHLFHLGQHEAALDKLASLKEDPLRVLGLYPKLLPDPCLGRWKYPYGIQTLAGPVLDNAFRALGSYLQRVRAERAEAVAAAVAADAPIPEEYNACADLPDVILDTALLRALLKIEHPFLAELAAAPNRCHIGVCEAALLQAKRYRPLVALYRGRGLHTKALELLNKLGHESSTGDMYGVGPTVKYLQGLGNTQLPLLLEYSVWVLHEDEDAGLSIFTAPRERPEALNAAAVLKHLDKHAVGAVADYLEHLINVQGETEPAFHNELIFTYLRSIQVILRNPASGAARPPQKAAAEIGLLGVIRKKLLLFLEASTHYKAEKMLSRFPTQDLYEERAVLLSRIGRHDQALAIYAHRLEDTAMAEAYAERHYTSGDARDVYLTLLDVYLSATPKPMLTAAWSLLNRYHHRIDAIAALGKLPPSLRVAELEPFFNSVVVGNEQRQRDNRLQRALLKAEVLSVKEQWHRARARKIVITEKHVCPVCQRRIGRGVMFVAYPDGRVLHYVCNGPQETPEKKPEEK